MNPNSNRLHISLLAIALASATHAWANPVGGTVASGSASFATTGTTLTVTNAPNTIINWQGFSIGAGETTRFVQSSSSSAVLNRVTTQSASSILGSLQSNGRVFLVNPNGILFGSGAQVNTASFTATTIDIPDGAFLSGNTTTSGAGSTLSFDGLMTVTAGNLIVGTNGVSGDGNILFAGQQVTVIANAINVNGGITAIGDLSLGNRNSSVSVNNPIIAPVTGAATISVGDAADTKPIVVPSDVVKAGSNAAVALPSAGPITLASAAAAGRDTATPSTNPGSITVAQTIARAASVSVNLPVAQTAARAASVSVNLPVAPTVARAASVSVNLQKREALY